MRLKLEIKNAAEVAKKLEALGDKGLKAVKDAALSAMEDVKNEIVRNTPRDSGDLAGGFVVKPGSKRKGGANAVTTIADRHLEYAFYLEFGVPHRKRGGALPARPFIRPAFDRKRKAAIKEFEQEIKKRLELE